MGERTVHLIHGFNNRNGGHETVGRWQPYFHNSQLHHVGYISLIDVPCRNREVVKAIKPYIAPGDIIVAHSNGCLIAHDLCKAGAEPSAIICVTPALRRDTLWPPGVRVLCLYSSSDSVVLWGLRWARAMSRFMQGPPHGWGAAGRFGFTAGQPLVDNFDMAMDWWPEQVKSHSGAFETTFWPEFGREWLGAESQ